MLKTLFSNDSKKDLSASIVVFLVALPLAMGISIASGYPPVAGLITGVIGGIIVGFLSGSPLQVSGAAAGLTVIVIDGVQRFGLTTMAVVVSLAGVFQVLAAAMKLGRWFQAVSPAVLYGMLGGIGVLISASQIHVMLDLTPPGSGLDNILAIPASAQQLASNPIATQAFLMGGLTIAIIMIWPRFARGKLALLPASLLAIVAAAAGSTLLGLQIVHIDIPQNLFSEWHMGIPAFGQAFENPALLSFALQLALIASAESLLCAGAVDQLHDGPRTKYDKELFAQGIGNVLCGFASALPMTGVIVRSSANVQSGAKTRLSTIMHGVWILLFIALLPGLLSYIPTAALAGLLVYTGIKLLNVKMMRKLWAQGKGEFMIYATTLGTVVAVDLLLGVVVGLVLSGAKLLYSLSHLSISTEEKDEHTPVTEPAAHKEVVVNLQGAATFLRLPTLSSTLERIPPRSRIVLKAHDLRLIDHACVNHLESWCTRHVGQGGEITIDHSVHLHPGTKQLASIQAIKQRRVPS